MRYKDAKCFGETYTCVRTLGKVIYNSQLKKYVSVTGFMVKPGTTYLPLEEIYLKKNEKIILKIL